MLTLIHGDDIAASRKYFIDLKQKHPDGINLDANDVTLTDLAQILEGGELFSDSKTLFVEQLITKKKNQSDYKAIISYLTDQGKSSTIFLWEGKDLDISATAAFKGAIVRPFKLPQSLFQFLDDIKPGNGKRLLTLFHQTLETVEAEAVFPMLIRQIRLLLALHGSNEAEIDEIKKMQAPNKIWQKEKLKKQARLFSESQLISLHKKLFELEIAQKTGGLPISISSSIDIFLLEV
jgi:hypothetical protein